MKDWVLEKLFFFNILWAFSGLWIFNDGLKILLICSSLLMILQLTTYRKETIAQIKNHSGFILSMFTLVIANMILGLFFNSFQRAIISLIILIPLIKFKPKNSYFIDKVILISCIIHASYLVYNVFYIGEDRLIGNLNPNIYAPIFGLLFVISINVFFDNKKPAYLIISALLLSCVFLMLSRSVILACIFCFIISSLPKMKLKNIILTFAIIALIPFLFSNKPVFEKVFSRTKTEINHISHGNLDGSFGLRVQMFFISCELIKQHPIIGHGKSFTKARNTIIDKEKYNPEIKKYKTLHNVYFDSWSKMGIAGFFLFIIFTIYPYFLLRNTKYNSLGIGLTSFTFFISMFDTALLGGPYLLVLFLAIYLFKNNNNNLQEAHTT